MHRQAFVGRVRQDYDFWWGILLLQSSRHGRPCPGRWSCASCCFQAPPTQCLLQTGNALRSQAWTAWVAGGMTSIRLRETISVRLGQDGGLRWGIYIIVLKCQGRNQQPLGLVLHTSEPVHPRECKRRTREKEAAILGCYGRACRPCVLPLKSVGEGCSITWFFSDALIPTRTGLRDVLSSEVVVSRPETQSFMDAFRISPDCLPKTRWKKGAIFCYATSTM